MKCGRNIIKIISILLITALTATLIFSCGSAESPSNSKDLDAPDNQAGIGDDANSNDDPAQEAEPDIPVVDMNGKEITFALLNWASYEPLDIIDIEVEELTGEAFNDVAYNRNMYMEQTYNCKVNSVSFPDGNAEFSKIRNSIKSGDEAYDIVLIRSRFYLSALTQGLLQSIDAAPYIDLNNPWWDKTAIDIMSLGKKNYALMGDYTTAIMNCVWNTYFNKKLIEDFGLENPYALVKEGKWTVDKMYEMGKGVASDLNSDGKMDTNDRYGVAHIVDSATSLLNSFGERFVDIDSDGVPYLSLGRESAMSKFMHIVDIFSDHDSCFNAHFRTNEPFKYEAQMFINNQALFCLGGIYYAPEMRAMEEEYGILPYPKFDENQKEYYNSILIVALPLLTIPVTNGDLENTGLFLEAYSYQGYKNVRPQFYDVLLQRKIARDDESAEMLDFIFNNLFIDIGALYDFAGISATINDMNGKGNANIASYLEKNTEKIEKEIQKFVDALTKG